MSDESPLPLPDSFRRYWLHLVPSTLFPSFAAVLLSRWPTPWVGGVVFVTFFAVAMFASWPVRSKRARFSFYLLTIGLFFGGTILLIPLVGFVSSLLLGPPIE